MTVAPRSRPRFDLRTPLTAALVLACTQAGIETAAIAVWFRDWPLIPYPLSEGQTYDFCIKLLLLQSWTKGWLVGTAVDSFLASGATAKLAVGPVLLAANCAVLALLALVLAALLFIRRRAPRPRNSLLMFVAVGLVVHLVIYPYADVVRWLAAGDPILLEVLSHGAFETLVSITVLAASIVVAGGLMALRGPLRIGAAAMIAIGCLIAPVLYPGATTVAEAAAPAITQPRRNTEIRKVLLISIDSLRADRLGCYGNSRSTSPTMDRLASTGVRFDDAVSTTSWTLPSHMSMLTGRNALSHGVIDEGEILIHGIPTLAETLRDEGFLNVGIVSEGVLLGDWRGFGRGFDHYHDIPELDLPTPKPGEFAPAATELAIEYLRQNRDRRLFLFLHYWDVHYDYDPPAPYDSMFDPDYDGTITPTEFIDNEAIHAGMPERDLQHVIALYDGEVRWVDDHIARLVGSLEELDLLEETAIVVTADHGDEFFEHGGKGHGLTLYREVMQVPLIMRAPGLPSGTIVRQPVSLIDVMPSLLHLLGIAMPAGMDGLSLLPAIMGAALPAERAVYAVRCALAEPGCLFLRHSATDSLILSLWPFATELYAATEARQQFNVAEARASDAHMQTNRLVDALDQQWAAFRDDGGRYLQPPIDETTKARMRELGYIP